MKKIKAEQELFARIRVIGVGGSGKNAINHMIKKNIKNVEFIVANTDAQDIKSSNADHKLHIGSTITRGLGTGMDANLGKEAANISKKEIEETIKGSDMLFITCGMGGGTGTGASPVIAGIAKDLGVLTVAVVTLPFDFEGAKRMELAKSGIESLRKNVDAILIIPNDNILKVSDKDTSMGDAFALSDDVLAQSVKGITDIILSSGTINVDFADVRTIVQNAGDLIMGVGSASGNDAPIKAVSDAIDTKMLDLSIKGAHRVLFSIACNNKNAITMQSVKTIADKITETVDPDARIIFGTFIDTSLKATEVKVTVVAGSFGHVDRNVENLPKINRYESNQESTDNDDNVISISDQMNDDDETFRN